MNDQIRVRFAPSPTGFMHLGNVRTALLNYLFAQQKDGTFLIRVEDTDSERNFDPQAQQIFADLSWLGLTFTEGGALGGPYAPYYQSQRSFIYQEHLDKLKQDNAIYRCFCTPKELEQKRARAIAMKIAPRYDRACLQLSEEAIQEYLKKDVLFVWRFRVPADHTIFVHDLAHGKLPFESNNFTDFPLTRSDGSFTFLFSNCVDDMLMRISHVLRGEDHLSNTASQLLLYEAFQATAPLFWHLPILCNADGKKLSKRDFGFSLNDLKKSGFLPEAITNYLAIIGGSYPQEIMDMKELASTMHFDAIKPVSNIRYDTEKLQWVNHKWIQRYDAAYLTKVIRPYLEQAYPQAKNLDDDTLTDIAQLLKTELVTLNDIIPALHFYFNEPVITAEAIFEHIPTQLRTPFIEMLMQHAYKLTDTNSFLNNLAKEAKQKQIPNKLLFMVLRLIFTGSVHGPSIREIMTILGNDESKKRLLKCLPLKVD